MNIFLSRTYSFCQLGQRKNQEDARFPDMDIIDKQQCFFVVCDGVGGSEKGEVASATVCQSFQDALSEVDLASMIFDEDCFSQVLDAAYDALDGKANSQNRDMATTMTFVCFHQGGCMMAHIGDSRIYQVRPGQGIIYRSEDHSLVTSLVRAGVISPDQAVDHPQSNVITRCMEPKQPDRERCMAMVFNTEDVRKGDYFFLCTDGVLHRISDNSLEDILTSNRSNQEKMDSMASLCMDSPDNNTAILIQVAGVEEDEEQADDSQNGNPRTQLIQRGKCSSVELSSEPDTKDGFWKRIKKKLFNS